jgi:carboxymethylenebutenolidase
MHAPQDMTMSTDENTSWINIPNAEGLFSGYLALPPAGRGPGLLLLQEIFGVNPHIRAVAEQYAQDGFVVLAPDLFWRDAHRVALGYEGDDRERAYALMKNIQPGQVLADLQAALAALKARPECTGKLGALGYCMGGRLAYMTAATQGVDAAVAYYGGGIQNQLDLAGRIACPVQFHYAEQDDHIPPAAVAQVQAAMAGKAAEFHLYPGTRHGFNRSVGAAYDPGAAALAHGRSLVFLSQLF